MSTANLPPPLQDEELAHHVASLRRDGYCVMEGAISAGFAAEILAEIERLEAVRPGGDIPPAPFTGHVTRRWFDLLNDGEVWERVAVHPWLMQLQEQALGEGFLLSTMGTAVIGHGEPAQPIHVDDGIYGLPRPHPDLVCNTIWALTDFTEETGATRMVPGSHVWDEDPDAAVSYDTVPLLMPAGSICAFLGSLYHGAGENRSGKDRVALTINYCRGVMRQQENLMLSISPQRMMSFTRQLQDILGFKKCRGTGHIIAQDPRVEMGRHYGGVDPHDPYLDVRNTLHAERLAAPRAPRRT